MATASAVSVIASLQKPSLLCTGTVSSCGALRRSCAMSQASLLSKSEFWGDNRASIHSTPKVCSPRAHRSSVLRCQAALDTSAITAAVYGTALLGGGLSAYLRTGSKGSLGGGVTGGVLLGVSFLLIQDPEKASLGYALAFGSALLFASVFGIRLFATGKAFPAGPLLAASLAASLIFASAYFS
eukprot:TRINITY_DN3960_c0_g1_i2.p1 TRINITY_DN3960_c0_g1~~TRINITY_DN3960_c0_g1_i2.p1  ORF type:complete len:184 (-),score=28.77 TRINITY_DN3960_c0_g1_i2:710-1261(-)